MCVQLQIDCSSLMVTILTVSIDPTYIFFYNCFTVFFRSRYISDIESDKGDDDDEDEGGYSTSSSMELPSPPTPPAALQMSPTTPTVGM